MNRGLRLASTLAVGAGLIGAALAAAAYAAKQAGPPPVSGLAHYRVFYLAALTLVLLIPAFSLFILQRRMTPSSAWRGLWTVAYAAHLAHISWAITGMMGGDVTEVFRRPDLVSAPWPDLALTLWWGADVLVAWTVTSTPRCVHVQRAALNVALFAAWTIAAIPQGQGLVRALGIIVVLTTLTSVAARIALREFDRNSLIDRVYVAAFQALNRVVPWYRLPTWLAVLNLGALREVLRRRNLHDTSDIPVTRKEGLAPPEPFAPAYLLERSNTGSYNDLDKPTMGRSSHAPGPSHEDIRFTQSHPGARFGRNVPLAHAYPDTAHLLRPSPREISLKLLARREFIPAPTLNLLAAAWIQFQTHDWFSHGDPPRGDEHEVPLPKGDRWHECPMRIRRTRPDPTRDYQREAREARAQGRAPAPPTYANAGSHWWDASQIYSNDPEIMRQIRTDQRTGRLVKDGKLFLVHGYLPLDPTTRPDEALTGLSDNWWVGLSLMHTLFAREHNAICDRLRGAYAEWSDDRIFTVARMVNIALMAKIHTVEWTPAILGHPALRVSMNANWWGLQTERVRKLLGRISENEVFGGIPGSGVDHHGADYCLTEEFVAVYRMHTLVPDEITVRSYRTGRPIKSYTFPEGVVGPERLLHMLAKDDVTIEDMLYSFGTSHPGAITLHNYPRFLQTLTRHDGEIVDLASVEILRDRERGVPRYNQFRRLMHLPPIRSFDELKNPLHPGLPEELRAIYGTTAGEDNVEDLDLMVGMYSETPPQGFGFSDTAFRIFILMASRRLKSDRFFASEFDPDVYSDVGLDWINENTMKTILLRHFPELGPLLRQHENAFTPWASADALTPR